MATATELIVDPLFQQNVVLWLAQEGPRHGNIDPVLHAQGFEVLAVERLLSLPAPTVSALAATSIDSKRAAAPDVLLVRYGDDAENGLLIVECKRNSFGIGSTTARQARAMMLACGDDAAAIVGIDDLTATLLSYLVPDDQAGMMRDTLSDLGEEIRSVSLAPGNATVLALGNSGVDGTVDLVVGNTAAAFVGLREGGHTVLRFPTGTDPRPLYFFPLDPGIEQSEAERSRCELDLRKRLHQHMVSRIGEAGYPADFPLDLDALLDKAYFGLYKLWDSRDNKRHLRAFAHRFVHRGLLRWCKSRPLASSPTTDGHGACVSAMKMSTRPP